MEFGTKERTGELHQVPIRGLGVWFQVIEGIAHL